MIGVVYDVLPKVDKFVFPADFLVLDCEIVIDMPVILGIPFFDMGKLILIWKMVSRSFELLVK